MDDVPPRAGEDLRQQIAAIVEAADDMTIATVRPDGCPHATTVSYVSAGTTIWFGTDPGSQKAQNLGRCDRVSLTINLPYRSWDEIRGLVLEGRARRVTDADELDRVRGLMLAKFPQIASYISPDASPEQLAIFRVDAQTASMLDYTQGFGHTDDVRL